jgi:predicted amidohydrolase
MDDTSVAAVMMRSLFGDVARNLKRTRRLASRAADSGADVICFPEANITGYGVRGSMARVAQPIPGDVTDELADIAHETDALILAGMIEKAGRGKPFVSHVAVGPEGLLAVYRKIHLAAPERRPFRAGDDATVFCHRSTTFGVQLCYDAHFPELTTHLARAGAEVVFVPHASPGPETAKQKRERWMRYLPARAYDNSLFVVACNQVGDNGAGLALPGVALALGPKGEVLKSATSTRDRIVLVDLPAAVLTRTRSSRMAYFLPNRRPEVYGAQSKAKSTP